MVSPGFIRRTNLLFKRSTQMAHTHTNKLELGFIVCKQFCINLHASCCLNKHLTGESSSYTPLLVLGPAPHDPRVHKPTIRETRMTRVVNGVRHEPSAVCAHSALAGQLRKLRRTQTLLRKHTHPGPGSIYSRGSSSSLPFPACPHDQYLRDLWATRHAVLCV
jgi:hypothetical protein